MHVGRRVVFHSVHIIQRNKSSIGQPNVSLLMSTFCSILSTLLLLRVSKSGSSSGSSSSLSYSTNLSSRYADPSPFLSASPALSSGSETVSIEEELVFSINLSSCSSQSPQ